MKFIRIQTPGGGVYDVALLRQDYTDAQLREALEEMAARIPDTFDKTDGQPVRIKDYAAIEIVDDGVPEVPAADPAADFDPSQEIVGLNKTINYLGNDITFVGVQYFHQGQVIVVVGAANFQPVEAVIDTRKAIALLAESYKQVEGVTILAPGPYMDRDEAIAYAKDYARAVEAVKPCAPGQKTGRAYLGWGLDEK